MAEPEPTAPAEENDPAEPEETTKSPKDSKAKPAPTLADMFKAHASKAGGAEATSADISKWCKDAGIVGKTCDAGHVDISFTKVKQKAAKLVQLCCCCVKCCDILGHFILRITRQAYTFGFKHNIPI